MVLRALVCAIFILGGAFGQAHAAADTEKPALTIGFMPYLNAELLIEKYTPLARYLSAMLGRDVRIEVAKDYAEHMRKTGEDELDISFLGGSPYVVIGDAYGPKPLLARYEFDGRPTFRSVIFVSKDSPLQSLSELHGKRVAFGNINSTLSTQVPLSMIMRAGLTLTDLAEYKFLRNHTNVVLGVEFGDFDAGAVAEEVYIENMGRNIRPLAHSPDLSTHVFVTRSTMDASLQKEISMALVSLKRDLRGSEILDAIGGNLTGFAPVTDKDYDLHREILRQVLPVLNP